MANPFFRDEELDEQELERQLNQLNSFNVSPEMSNEIGSLENKLYSPAFTDLMSNSKPIPPPEPTPIPVPESQPSNLADLLQRYKDAQASREQGVQGANFLRAADIAATGIAGAGAKRAPEELFKGIEDQYSLPVKNIQEEIKGRPDIQKVYTEEQMSDPSSDVSRLAQQAAIKIYPEMKDKLEKLSGRQLAELGFKVKDPYQQMMKDKKQVISTYDPKTGLTHNEIVNLDTGQRTPLGEKGFSYQTVVDPYTGERVLNRDLAAGAQPRGTPVIKPESTKPEEKPDVEFKNKVTETYSKLKPIHVKKLDDLSKEYATETKDQRTSFDSIDNLAENSIDLATKNEISAAQLGAQVAGIYENGKLTDEDVLRYTRRQGVVSRIKDYATELATGTITKDKAKELKTALSDYKEGLRKKLSERALEKSRTLIPSLNAQGIDVDPRHLSPSIYGNYDDSIHNIVQKKPNLPPGTIIKNKTTGKKFQIQPNGSKKPLE